MALRLVLINEEGYNGVNHMVQNKSIRHWLNIVILVQLTGY
jgi:hypothetical protein